jgi:hypothetical protein
MATTSLLDLATLIPQAVSVAGLTPALATVFVEASAVCLEHNKHKPGVTLHVRGTSSCAYALSWPQVTQQIRDAHHDLQEATERGATGIAVHLARDLLGLELAQRSRKGGGFDYWLCPAGQQCFLFQNTTRMEVSGILTGSSADVQSRVNQKKRQIAKSSGTPSCIVVVEFSEPQSHIVT